MKKHITSTNYITDYCNTCKKEQEPIDVRWVITEYRTRLRGDCSVCKTEMYLMLRRPWIIIAGPRPNKRSKYV